MKISPIGINTNFGRKLEGGYGKVEKEPKSAPSFIKNPDVDLIKLDSTRLITLEGKPYNGSMTTTAPNGKKVELFYEDGALKKSEIDGKMHKFYINYFSDFDLPVAPYQKVIITHKTDELGNPTEKEKAVVRYNVVGTNAPKIKSVCSANEAGGYETRFDDNGNLVSRLVEAYENGVKTVKNYNKFNSMVFKKSISDDGSVEIVEKLPKDSPYQGFFQRISGKIEKVGNKNIANIDSIQIFDDNKVISKEIDFKEIDENKVITVLDYEEGQINSRLEIDYKPGEKVKYTYDKAKDANIVEQLFISSDADKKRKVLFSNCTPNGFSENHEPFYTYPACASAQVIELGKKIKEVEKIATQNSMNFPFAEQETLFANVFGTFKKEIEE